MATPLELWLEKKTYLEQQLAITSEPSQKFTLHKQIEECEEAIKEFPIFGHVRTVRQFANPPNPPPLFIGRNDDIHFIKERLGITSTKEKPLSVQVLTAVRGWPGVGKTATATVLARDLDIAKTFPDGVLWASLGEKPDLRLEMSAWAHALKTTNLPHSLTLKEIVILLTELLKNKRTLLIVDDVWETDHIAPFQQTKGKDCALLITTRLPSVVNELSLPSEAIYNLPVLTEEKALELLSILAPSVTNKYPDECKKLVCDIEYLPLALHVAGRMLNMEEKTGLGITDLLKELKEGANIIEAKAPSNLIDLENETIPTVATLLRKSTERLDAQTRRYFTLLGPFAPKPASFDLNALKFIWSLEDPKPVIRTLINHGMLEPLGAGRFQMHALLISHAKSMLRKR